ncbi:hypothetical protein C1646_728361, partial [Rhizophagus diaphanus]
MCTIKLFYAIYLDYLYSTASLATVKVTALITLTAHWVSHGFAVTVVTIRQFIGTVLLVDTICNGIVARVNRQFLRIPCSIFM